VAAPDAAIQMSVSRLSEMAAAYDGETDQVTRLKEVAPA